MKYTDDFFSMIRHVTYLTRSLQEDLMLRDLIASIQSSRNDVPRYYPIKRSRTSPVDNAYWQISEMTPGVDLSEPLPLSRSAIPDGLEHAYQEGLKAMGAYPTAAGPTIKFRRYKPLDEVPLPLGYIPLEKEGLTFNDTEVCRHQYNMILKAMEKSVTTGVGFVDMLAGIKEVGNKKDFPPNWGKVNF